MTTKRSVNSQVLPLVALGLLILIATAVSANYQRKTPAPSGISGTTRVQGACPQLRLDETTCSATAEAVTVQVILESSGSIVSEFTSAVDGRYQIQLPAGKYIIRSRPDVLYPMLKPEVVTVDSAKYLNIDLLFDSQAH